MDELFIPTLHTFAMDNIYTGSSGDFRFRIQPKVVKSEVNPKEVDMEKSNLLAECWHGPFCYEKSEMDAEQTFPMSEEGRTELRNWLMAHL